MKKSPSNSSSTIGLEANPWLSTDKLRSNLEADVYKHFVFGLIFLEYNSDSFDEYLTAQVFWVNKAGWAHLQANVELSTIGEGVDGAMLTPCKRHIHDLACDSGPAAVESVHSEQFVQSNGGQLSDVSIYVQETHLSTRRPTIVNMGPLGIEVAFGLEHADTFPRDLHPSQCKIQN